ncbi:MAG TPA: hypothetical protein VMU57_16705 [Edaphobacter sp.]|jgi:hypothetical protein|uniref:hypothetical protein n=1 Tax=Edaphobacter sp. TaxID=1934404 RepID=UPI002D1A728C|nr:hypothetical protein [Edaphobacter sp.]HUZ96543.1 hypothetical protein [Edaphobacter sp.]
MATRGRLRDNVEYLLKSLLARATNHWQTNMPNTVYMDLAPHANQVTHSGI